MPRRASRSERARNGEQSHALAAEIFAAGGRLGAVGAGDGQRNVGQAVALLDGHGYSPSRRMKREIGSAEGRLKACPSRAWRSLSHSDWTAWLNRRPSCPASCCWRCRGWPTRGSSARSSRMCVHDENGAIGIGVGHKRAGISFRGLAAPARNRSRTGARRRRPPRRTGRARPRLRAPFDRLGRAGHAPRERPRRERSSR